MEKENNAHYFYVLWCKDNTFYAGYTTNLMRRLAEHNSGQGAKYTKPHAKRPVQMVHHERFNTRSAAMRAEAAFKKLTRAQKIKYLKAYGIHSPEGTLHWRKKRGT
ncbi:GIY-YIG nuclease family protein [Allofustis seminis]|uniref:GIY-YIG nuclease family protein n=1 Tax=Allofustis seminis TaxID=166939 RepID=UPI0003633D19|nr:GIY-YIG nuclease family protein [Allofustis seminis]